jgi:Divergent InlB B-repeat domain
MGIWTRRFVLASLAIILLSLASPSLVHAAPVQPTPPHLVPTTLCSCQTEDGANSSTVVQLRGHHGPPPTTSAYDEQIGETFTQSFTSLEYNVTAVVQTDATLDTGPGYLLNGLSNSGYWYQVGVSWNWSPGESPGTGFGMNYEVFDTDQNSIFPQDGGGGVQAFTGTVNAGDTILLNLYFTSSGQVMMAAQDLNTGAFASETYSAVGGGTYFVGLTSGVSNSNGYFTGLMTEWYHGNPFYSNGKEVVYSNSQFALSSAWMWMDEFDVNTNTGIFTASSPAPLNFSSNPTHLQEFSYNGTTEYGDSYEFITGNLTGTGTSTTLPLTLSYSVQGGGIGYAPPVFTYVSNGVQLSATLNSSAVTYNVDVGSTWSVSADLNGSSSTGRWQTDQNTTGVATSAQTIALQYYHQYQAGFAFGVEGGGSGYSSPTVTYVSFGSPVQVLLPSGSSGQTSGVWSDAGSPYNYTNPLPGSSSGERWESGDASGTVSSPGTITATYQNQYLVTVEASFGGSEIFPSVTLSSTSAGSPFTGTIVQGTTSFWLDANASYTIPQTISLSQGERWAVNSTAAGVVSGQVTIPLAYQYQYYVAVGENSADGGSVSPASGWYLPGTSLQLTAAPSSGWKSEGWTGTGSGSSSGPASDLSLTVSGPANETATFYPGVSITSTGPVSIAYQDGSTSGTVSSGTSSVVYVPPSSTLSLSASSVPFLYSFTGWSGDSSLTGTSVSLVVNGPESVTGNSSYNYTDIAVILVVVILIALAAVFAIRTRSRNPAGTA